MSLDTEIWLDEENLSLDDNISLNEPFFEKEVKSALDIMVKMKSLGPDGIPVEFYQVCWNTMKDDIMCLFHDWHLGNLNLYMLNFGMIIIL
jgi:hypothetical protein